MRDAIARLEAMGAKQGPCFLCGPPTLARHRLWDAIDGAQRNGEAVTRIWSGISLREVRLVRAAYALARRQHRKLPGR